MLKLLKIKKSKNSQATEEVLDALEEVQEEIASSPAEEKLPQIKLFISKEQLSALKEHDEEREQHALLYLNGDEKKEEGEDALLKEFEEKFERAFSPLGNANSKCPHCLREYSSAPAEVKKCLGCSKGFFKTKRPQDGLSVLAKEEHRKIIEMQWENIKKPEMIENLDMEELKKCRAQLEAKEGGTYSLYDTHFFLIRSYAAKALRSGRFRLYASLIYYMAEHDRYEKKFAKALSYYFYLYFLQLNGASNSVVFGDKVRVNQRVIDRIGSLLTMAKMMTTECEEFFRHAIETRTAFEFENLPYGIDESFAHLVKEFDKAEGRGVKIDPMQKTKKPKRFGLRRQ